MRRRKREAKWPPNSSKIVSKFKPFLGTIFGSIFNYFGHQKLCQNRVRNQRKPFAARWAFTSSWLSKSILIMNSSLLMHNIEIHVFCCYLQEFRRIPPLGTNVRKHIRNRSNRIDFHLKNKPKTIKNDAEGNENAVCQHTWFFSSIINVKILSETTPIRLHHLINIDLKNEAEKNT